MWTIRGRKQLANRGGYPETMMPGSLWTEDNRHLAHAIALDRL